MIDDRRLTLMFLVKYVPSWIPGASFKRKANEWRKTAFRPRDIPFDWVENELVRTKSLVIQRLTVALIY